jgi:plasmid stabilization system protein ParE
MKIIWSPLANARMEEISDYIARDNPSAADKWLCSVFEKVDLLNANTQMGCVDTDTNVTSIRDIVLATIVLSIAIMPKN